LWVIMYVELLMIQHQENGLPSNVEQLVDSLRSKLLQTNIFISVVSKLGLSVVEKVLKKLKKIWPMKKKKTRKEKLTRTMIKKKPKVILKPPHKVQKPYLKDKNSNKIGSL